MSSSPEGRPAGMAVDFAQLEPSGAPEPAPNLQQAALKARQLVAAAEAEAERIRSESRDAGHAEGFAAGRSDALYELAPTASAAAETLTAVRALEADHAERVEGQAVELAVRIAEKVVAGT